MSGKNSKKAKRNGIFAAIWLLLILILIIVFLVKKDDFANNLKSTNFFERVVGSTPDFIQNYETKKKENKSNGLLDVDVAPVPGQKETQAPGTYDLDDLASEQEQEQAAESAAKPEKESAPETDGQSKAKEEAKAFFEKDGTKLLLLIGKDPYVYASQVKNPKYKDKNFTKKIK